MRMRRPHLFSDSKIAIRRTITREVLSHHLETLTNQKDESVFEEFARRLSEKFISPNLRPQTGPTGGGDGKTDAETYPVARAIALRWFLADLAPAHERWAFAFSAKKDWRAKIRSDVAGIVGTERGYPHIYFVTNQFVPARAGAIGALLLRTSFDDLAAVAKLPDALERLRLDEVKLALLFLMDHEDTLRKTGAIPPEETSESYHAFFEHWREQGDNIELPEVPDYLLGKTVLLRSRVLGCEIKVTCTNNLTSIGIGEAILGALEALLATSLPHRILPHLDVLEIRIDSSADAPLVPELCFVEENGATVGIVTHAPQLTYTTREEAVTLPRWLQRAVIEIFLRFAVPADAEKWMASILGEENGFSRALTFSDIPTMMGVIFGNKDRLTIDEWIGEADINYAVRRTAPWNPKQQNKKTEERKRPEFADGEPPDGMFDLERLKHTDVQVVSPIDVRKWDAARWKATYFMMVPGADVPPVLGLAFGVREPAVAIFEGFRRRFGFEDPKNNLRIAIIRGVRISNPNAYAVLVGPNFENIPPMADQIFEFVSRINIMEPESSRNLNAFLAEYDRHGRYLLAPAHMPRVDREPEVIIDAALGKYDLIVREAWQIGENDPDSVVLDPNDPPVVPLDKPNPPVLKALKRIECFHRDDEDDPLSSKRGKSLYSSTRPMLP
jgi:hypothetical protein